MNLIELLSSSGHDSPGAERVHGAVVAVVTSVDDPDGLGRVKIKFPWLTDNLESRLARVVSFMAGATRGAVFRPEVGDEVLVVFEHGDMRFPYVVGGLWNGSDAPPSERGSDAANDVRMIKSRSGHLVVFDDSPGAEKVTISDSSGNSVELSQSGVLIKSGTIKLGGTAAAEGLVLGDAFMQLFNTHTHATGVGPSSPPSQPMVTGQHVSAKHKTE